MEWVIKNAKGRTMRAQAFKIVYTECVYAIWLEWNQQVFEKKPEIMKSLPERWPICVVLEHSFYATYYSS
ncbi:hypothetical protein KY289_005172 [Solanum tuberosum]|nr:hypothetical protein KY289_005172 [Solanum tuberosum]